MVFSFPRLYCCLNHFGPCQHLKLVIGWGWGTENSDIYYDMVTYANIEGSLTYRCIYNVYPQALFEVSQWCCDDDAALSEVSRWCCDDDEVTIDNKN